MSKYGSRKKKIDGIVFHSIAESKYYETLKIRKLTGGIADFELQPSFELQPGFEKGCQHFKKITYKADFKIIHHSGLIEIVDIKGAETKEFAIKRKLFEYKYPYLRLILLAYNKKTNSFVDWDADRREKNRAKKAKWKAQKALRAGAAQANG